MTQALIQGNYPSFVLMNHNGAQVPAFTYHKVDCTEFEQHLIHLQRNGYRTLTADHYYTLIHKEKSIDDKAVLLTFDDGLANLYTVVYPLLKRYGFKIVAFILPSWVGKRGMITWEQVLEMHHSGLVDFQSHSLDHASIFVSKNITGFFEGDHDASPIWDVPWDIPMVRRDGRDRLLCHSDLGSPLFKSASRMSDARRYFPDPALEAACMEVAQRNVSGQPLNRKAWRKNLLQTVERHQSTTMERSYYESAAEQRQAIKEELILSKRAIEDKLAGKSVQYFSFPWNQSGKLVKSLLPECGYKAVFRGLSSHQDEYNDAEAYEFPRVNGDFLPRLPGKGRSSLHTVLYAKIKRRLTLGEPYW